MCVFFLYSSFNFFFDCFSTSKRVCMLLQFEAQVNDLYAKYLHFCCLILLVCSNLKKYIYINSSSFLLSFYIQPNQVSIIWLFISWRFNRVAITYGKETKLQMVTGWNPQTLPFFFWQFGIDKIYSFYIHSHSIIRSISFYICLYTRWFSFVNHSN